MRNWPVCVVVAGTEVGEPDSVSRYSPAQPNGLVAPVPVVAVWLRYASHVRESLTAPAPSTSARIDPVRSVTG